jgi:hypothetical protein
MNIRISYFGEGLVITFMIACWLAGLVLAKGFWMTVCALFPLYAWYLVVERAMQLYWVV